jgi:hypothetical protein
MSSFCSIILFDCFEIEGSVPCNDGNFPVLEKSILLLFFLENLESESVKLGLKFD